MRRSRRLLAPLASLLCVLGVFAPAASAGTVTGGTFTRFLANTGEINTVTVDRIGANYVFTDTTTPITAGAGCAAGGNPNTATCPVADVENLSAELGDMNDSGTFGPGVTGNNLQASISGGDGNDVITAGASIEATYVGEDGNDNLVGGPERDRLIGNDGNDTLEGNGEGDDLEPGDGNDIANGGPGDGDRLSTGSAPDGADVLSGGPGLFDSLDFRRDSDVSLTANNAADDGGPGEGDNMAGDIERIDTGEGDDLVAAGPLDNTVFLGGGDDQAFGEAGNDNIQGDEGKDVEHGGTGSDELSGDQDSDQLFGDAGDDFLDADPFTVPTPDQFSGGKGLDLIDYGGASDDLRVDLDNQADDGVAGEADNVHSDVEDVTGGTGNDRLTGSARANELDGGSGTDLLLGGKGPDGLFGSFGPDTLVGGKGADLLDGAAGPDRLRARDGGRDELRCGSATDRVKADRADRFGPDCDKVAFKGRRR
jgi:Ca2+-binding RTX toxin-like protein